MAFKLRSFLAGMAICSAVAIVAATLTHKVQPGENAYSISKTYGISVETLYKYNPQARDGVKAGEVLVLPDNGTVKKQETPTERDKAYHTIAKGESLYGIAKRYGMTVDELIALNPQVDVEGYAAGDVLRLRPDTAQPSATPTPDAQAQQPTESAPADNAGKDLATVIKEKVAKQKQENTQPETAPQQEVEEVEEDVVASDTTDFNEDEVELIATREAVELPRRSVVIMLPFMSESATAKEKIALHSTDFLRGFMIAADTLANTAGYLDIVVLDTYNSVDTVNQLLTRPEVKNASVIIAPSDLAQFSAIAKQGTANGSTWVLNLFAVKDESFRSNKHVIQANIPHDEMYRKAIDSFIAQFGKYTPVFIYQSIPAKRDKEEFTEMLRKELKAAGRQWIDIEYDGYLSASDLEALPPDGSYVFIPASASRKEFKTFVRELKNFKNSLTDPTAMKVFGYPEWITFQGESADDLGELEATVYSRFFLDNSDYGVRQFKSQFLRHYGRDIIDVYPSQAVLGYDAGCYVIKALQDPNFDEKSSFGKNTSGLQTPFRLDYDETMGPVNVAMYLIKFLPGGYCEKTVL